MRDEREVDAVRSMRCAGYRVECYTRVSARMITRENRR